MSSDKLFVIGPYEQLAREAAEVPAVKLDTSIFKSVLPAATLEFERGDILTAEGEEETKPEEKQIGKPLRIVDARFARAYCLVTLTDDLLSGVYVDPDDETLLRDTPPAKSPIKLFARRRGKEPMNGYQVFQQAIGNVEAVIRSKTEPITDIYIFSHGWHRNFYSALSAYDRMMSRFTELLCRGRLRDVPQPYNPLFVVIHYHSDTGEDDWVDYSGRKDKDSFLRLVEERLEPTLPPSPAVRGVMKRDFEDLFDLFSKLSAPEVDPFAARLGDDAYQLGELLNRYRPSDYATQETDLPEATIEEVLTIAWTCYHEADNQKATSEQDEEAGRFVTVTKWLTTVGGIVVAGLGITAVLGFLTQSKPLKEGVYRLFSRAAEMLFPGSLEWSKTAQAFFWIGFWTLLLWAAFGLLYLSSREKEFQQGADDGQESLAPRWRRARRKGGLKTFGTVIYLLLQAVHAIPILAYCLITPFFATMPALLLLIAGTGAAVKFGLFGLVSTPLSWAVWGVVSALSIGTIAFSRSQFQERFGSAGKGPKVYRTGIGARWRFGVQSVRDILLWFARLPARVVPRIMKSDERVRPLWVAIENQFAFWRMSRKATVAGEYVYRFLHAVVTSERKRAKDEDRDDKLAGARIHLLAHSHGGIVVTNAARWIANSSEIVESSIDEKPENAEESQPVEAGQKLKLQTVCTVNGAYMSTWYEKETVLLETVQGCVASIYSRYDTANSFWYPLANLGRKSAGSVGLWLGDPHPAPRIGEPLPSASLVESPNLADRIRRIGHNPTDKKVLNIDGSRLIYKGAVLPQGSHGDIFKDEVALLLWATTVYEKNRLG